MVVRDRVCVASSLRKSITDIRNELKPRQANLLSTPVRMFASSVCLLAATLVTVAAMPTTPAGGITSPRALCNAALVRTPLGPDLVIMKTCCSTETKLTQDQCQVVLQAMSEGPAEMMKNNSGGVMQKEAMPMEPGMTTKSIPEPNTSVGGVAETTPKGMEMKMNGTEGSIEEKAVVQNMFTLEMLDAEPIIMKCLMRTAGMISAEGVINESTVRYMWNKHVLPTAGEQEKKRLVAALETCPLTSTKELTMFPLCLVKTCAAAAAQ